MAEKSGESGKHRDIVAKSDRAREADGNDSLRGVADEREQSEFFPRDARDVGRADVTAARLAHVDAGKITENVAGRNGTEEVGEEDEENFGDHFNSSAILFFRRSEGLCDFLFPSRAKGAGSRDADVR